MKVLYFYSNFSIKFKFHHKGFPQSSQIGHFGGSSGPSRIQNWGQWGRRALWGARWGIVRASSTVSHVSCNYLPLLWTQFSTLKFSCRSPLNDNSKIIYNNVSLSNEMFDDKKFLVLLYKKIKLWREYIILTLFSKSL